MAYVANTVHTNDGSYQDSIRVCAVCMQNEVDDNRHMCNPCFGSHKCKLCDTILSRTPVMTCDNCKRIYQQPEKLSNQTSGGNNNRNKKQHQRRRFGKK
jgi:hypothetical protein